MNRILGTLFITRETSQGSKSLSTLSYSTGDLACCRVVTPRRNPVDEKWVLKGGDEDDAGE